MQKPKFVVSFALLMVTMSVNLQVPLYPAYAKAANFSNGLTTLVFAAYVAGLLPILILLGGVSDRIGRKKTILFGLTVASLATIIMILSPNVYTLFAARLLQATGVGLSVGAGTAYLTELIEPKRAANFVATTTALGFGGGALLTSLALLFETSLVPRSFWLVLILVAVAFVALTRLPEQTTQAKPIVRLPYFPKGSLQVGFAIALAWSVTGIIIAVVPSQLASNQLAQWAGLALFLVNSSGAAVQPIARRTKPTQALKIGFVLLPIGYAVVVVGTGSGILALVLAGAAIAGTACYGFIYLGGLAQVVSLATSQQARAVSGYFLWAYAGLGLPTVLIGFLADQFGIMTSLVWFGVVVSIACTVLFMGFTQKEP